MVETPASFSCYPSQIALFFPGVSPSLDRLVPLSSSLSLHSTAKGIFKEYFFSKELTILAINRKEAMDLRGSCGGGVHERGGSGERHGENDVIIF